MSGFLANLARRARGDVPRLAPRRPAPYEDTGWQALAPEQFGEVTVVPPSSPGPTAATGIGAYVAPTASAPDIEARARERNAAPVSAPQVSVSTTPAHHPQTARRMAAEPTPVPRATAAPSPAVPGIAPKAGHATATPKQPDGTAPAVSTAPTAAPAAPSVTAPVDGPVPGNPVPDRPPSAVISSERSDPVARPPAAGQAEPPLTDATTPPFAEPSAARPALFQDTPVAPSPARGPERDMPEPPPLLPPRSRFDSAPPPRAPAPQTAQGSAPEPPVVEVHIGTIDIVPDAPAPAPTAAPAPARRGISLDDFLDGAGRGYGSR